MSTLFFVAESVCLLLFLVATAVVWRLRYKPPYGLNEPQIFAKSMDVFLPCCGEPHHVIRAALRAASRISWDGPITVYVLDDLGDPKVQELAEEFGAAYHSRPLEGIPGEDAKSGNLNFGLRKSEGEFVLVLDADQVCLPGILKLLAGYMKFEDVAFVQSRQRYIVPEGDPFFNSDTVFYGTVQSGFDESNTAISCGSGVLYRRKALDSIGGFVQWNMVEDLTTSYELHRKGWKSFYVPYAFTFGLAPDTIQGVVRQRSQWALDAMRLIIWKNPIFRLGMTWRRRLPYLTIGISYICAGFVFPFFYSVPIWTYLTGNFVIGGNLYAFVLLRILYLIFMVLAMRYLYQGKEPGRQFRSLTGLFPVYLIGALRALVTPPGRKPQYRANNQARAPRRRRSWPAAILVAPQLALVLGNAVLPYLAIVHATCPAKYVFVNAFISAACIWSLWPILESAFFPKPYPEILNNELVYGENI